jgi:hypothetical protein
LTGNFATLAGRLREVAAALDGREEISPSNSTKGKFLGCICCHCCTLGHRRGCGGCFLRTTIEHAATLLLPN